MEDKRPLLQRLRDKYRLVILNDKTFEEKASVRLSQMNVFILLSVAVVLFTLFIGSLIVFTPLREYIPGYADVGMRRDLVRLYQTVDSLERAMNGRDLLLQNIRDVAEGKVDSVETNDSNKTGPDGQRFDPSILDVAAPFDSLLRLQLQREMVEVRVGTPSTNRSFQGVTFFAPASGNVVREFNAEDKQYGVGLRLGKEDGIKATLEGAVVFSGYTLADQYIIGIQHANNLVSWYKGMNQSLRKVGDQVRAGEVIGIGGGEGAGTRKVQLEFQLWYNGIPLNPAIYINF
ncbi:MAG: peptidase M23 [Sphingobacteriaceae bacterium]|nr:peptidase M23 [Sphingobacteriaceae bacterium]